MRRLKNIFQKKSLTYIFGEILLIFVGITLAIWFNNWNTSSTARENMDLALERLQGEVENNLDQIGDGLANYEFLSGAYVAFGKIYTEDSNTAVATPEHFNRLMDSFPRYFRLRDSVILDDGKVKYLGNTYINLDLPNLTEIAWDTSKSIGITNEFSYECLYSLESTYILQRRVENEINKASDALQNQDIEALMEILEFLKQLGDLLEGQYAELLDQLEDCK